MLKRLSQWSENRNLSHERHKSSIEYVSDGDTPNDIDNVDYEDAIVMLFLSPCFSFVVSLSHFEFYEHFNVVISHK